MRVRHGWFRVTVVTAAAAALTLVGAPRVEATSDEYWPRQYGPEQIGAPTAWQKSTGKGVTVAVIDSGIDVDHPDLRRNLDTANDYDFACDDGDPDDDSPSQDLEGKKVKGHGTHVAGIIGAVTNNSVGIAGVAPDVKLMGLKMSPTDSNCGSVLDFAGEAPQAIDWAVDHGAKVINLSYTEFAFGVQALETIVAPCNDAYRRGTLCVVAAGNSGETQSSGYPYDWNALVVTANDRNGAHATFGQRADTQWAVSAPGVEILSTWPVDEEASNGYLTASGTSMAAPHVAGAAAALFASGMNIRQVVDALLNTAGPARNSTVEGAGLIHMDRALGLQSTETTSSQRTGGGGRTVNPSSNRQTAAGGSAATTPPTTAPVDPEADLPGVSFEEGIAGEDESFEAIRLREADRNSASKPFNAVVPLVVLSIIAAVALVVLAVPRLRAKDSVPLG